MVLSETPTLIRAALYTVWYSKAPQSYGLDESSVDTQKRHVLLMHGAAGNWRYMYDLSQYLTMRGIQVSVINTGGGEATEEKRALVARKIAEIRARYTKKDMLPPKIDLVAHSLGGYLALFSAVQGGKIIQGELQETTPVTSHPHIGKLITLAMPYNSAERQLLKKAGKIDETYNIIARYDALMGQKEIALAHKNRATVHAFAHRDRLSPRSLQ